MGRRRREPISNALKSRKLFDENENSRTSADLVKTKKGLQKKDSCKEYNTVKVSPIKSTVGLLNLGNTCFFNAVIQCLSQTPYLLELLKETVNAPFNNDFEQLSKSLSETMEVLQKGDDKISFRKAFSPLSLLSNLIQRKPQFVIGDQHDSHELLRHLLEAIHEEQSSELSPTEQVFQGVFISTLQHKNCSHTSHCEEFFLDLSVPLIEKKPLPKKPNKNVIKKKIHTKKKKKQVVSKSSDVEDNESFEFNLSLTESEIRFIILPQEMNEKFGNNPNKLVETMVPQCEYYESALSVQACLNQFTTCEDMTLRTVNCEQCGDNNNGNMNIQKRLLIYNPPAVLILHLKRFEVNDYCTSKVCDHVSFPLVLDLAPYLSKRSQELSTFKPGQTQVLYSLYGVVEHSGTMRRGHYVSYIKIRPKLEPNSYRWKFLPKNQTQTRSNESKRMHRIPDTPPGKWYHANDSFVSEVKEATVLQAQAYILFYEQIY